MILFRIESRVPCKQAFSGLKEASVACGTSASMASESDEVSLGAASVGCYTFGCIVDVCSCIVLVTDYVVYGTVWCVYVWQEVRLHCLLNGL